MCPKKRLLVFYFLFIFHFAIGQQQPVPDRFFVTFTDKDHSGYSLSSPSDFLSAAALERRSRFGVPLDSRDLPVPSYYVDSLRAMGAEVHLTTRWLNGAVVSLADTNKLPQIMATSFTDTVIVVRNKPDFSIMSEKIAFEEEGISTGKGAGPVYGYAANQTSVINLDPLYHAGYDGDGVTIAVLDAGFTGADQMEGLAHLFSRKQIVSTRDFVDGGRDVFAHSTHGQMVLTVMAAHLPGVFMGTAPGASYILLRSEDIYSEYPVEELYWAAAAEYADSLGAHIINSSLGYSTFDNPSMSYSRQDMDGSSTFVTRAANTAASKGMLVVSSAGNSGTASWFHVVAPADGDSVLAVGAVNQKGEYAPFSSKGPAYGGNIKPNVAAVGENTMFLNTSDQPGAGNGTSFSAPMVAGAAATLWQASPNINHLEIKEIIQKSSSQYLKPDSLTGYGIPDFKLSNILTHKILKNNQKQTPQVMPNPFQNKFHLITTEPFQGNVVFEIFDMTGARIMRIKPENTQNQKVYTFNNLEKLSQGAYILRITHQKATISLKIYKSV